MDIDVKGRVRVYRNTQEGKVLVHDNHNVITYGGREVFAKRIIGEGLGFNNWSIHLGNGWSGVFGEPDPALSQLYSDFSSQDDTTTEQNTSVIYSMYGHSSNDPNGPYVYPILSIEHGNVPAGISISTTKTYVDDRAIDVEAGSVALGSNKSLDRNNAVTFTCTIGPFPQGTVTGKPINELGLFYNPSSVFDTDVIDNTSLSIMENSAEAVLVAYEPIYSTEMNRGGDTLTVEWEISF